jgi:hypothetical protein
MTSYRWTVDRDSGGNESHNPVTGLVQWVVYRE